jgi:hypothetical protein
MTVDPETTPKAFADAIAELVGWSGEYLHVEVSIADGAGICGFDARLEAIAGGEDERSVLLRFAGEAALVVLGDVVSASSISSEVGRLRFTLGEFQSIGLERVKPEEIMGRVTGVVSDG